MGASSYEIQGRRVEMPVRVRHARQGAATYLVSSRAAQRLLPGSDFRVAEVAPGRTLLSLAAIDYVDNDLGDYNEISVTLFVRPRGERSGLPWLGTWADFLGGRLGTWIHRLPVNQDFTRAAGCTIWGFPKWVTDIQIDHGPERSLCVWREQGEHVLTLSLPRGGTRTLPESRMVTYTHINGIPHRTVFTSSGAGVGFHLGGARLELGSHPIADELRSLGLPRRALLCVWNEEMSGTFEAPEKLEGGAS
jgi:Acetoacetate decarboxylase (ADC)